MSLLLVPKKQEDVKEVDNSLEIIILWSQYNY